MRIGNLNLWQESKLMYLCLDSAVEPSEQEMDRHDIVVIGASAGGVQALTRILGDIPRHFPAAIFIVVHTTPTGPGLLDRVLNRADGLKVFYPRDGTKIESGQIYLAPPDRDMILGPRLIRIRSGPKQNRHRPTIDALFRSAAAAYGRRVIGVVLTGFLDDGSSGLAAVKQSGGIAIVQDPQDAEISAMPLNALQKVEPDYCLPLNEIGGRLGELVLGKRIVMPKQKRPDCHGNIWEIDEGGIVRYECRVGHSYSPQSMMEAQGESLERALWAALKPLEENIAFTRRIAGYFRKRHKDRAADNYERQLENKQKHAAILRGLLEGKPEQILRIAEAGIREQDRHRKQEQGAEERRPA